MILKELRYWNQGNTGRKTEDQGAARSENCSRKLDFDENLCYRHLNSVRNQNLRSKRHSGCKNEGFFEIFWHIKNHKKFVILFWSWEPEKFILRIFRIFFTKTWAGIRNHEWDDGNPVWRRRFRESRVRRRFRKTLSRLAPKPVALKPSVS